MLQGATYVQIKSGFYIRLLLLFFCMRFKFFPAKLFSASLSWKMKFNELVSPKVFTLFPQLLANFVLVQRNFDSKLGCSGCQSNGKVRVFVRHDRVVWRHAVRLCSLRCGSKWVLKLLTCLAADCLAVWLPTLQPANQFSRLFKCVGGYVCL